MPLVTNIRFSFCWYLIPFLGGGEGRVRLSFHINFHLLLQRFSGILPIVSWKVTLSFKGEVKEEVRGEGVHFYQPQTSSHS